MGVRLCTERNWSLQSVMGSKLFYVNRFSLHAERTKSTHVMVFNFTEDIFLLHTRDHKNPVIFGLFNTTRWEIYMIYENMKQNMPYSFTVYVSRKYCWPIVIVYYFMLPISLHSLIFAVVLLFLKPWPQFRSLFLFEAPQHPSVLNILISFLSDLQQNEFLIIVYKILVPCYGG